MTRYVISDLHLDHENIIDNCNRPFVDVDDMNETLVRNWNRVVDSDDTVYYLGDLALWGPNPPLKWAPRLNGNIAFVLGNHDEITPEEFPFPVVDALVLKHGKYRFYCVHDPADVPDQWTDWVLHGHHHDNRQYPFIDSDSNQLNLSVEVTGYEPVSLDELTTLIDTNRRAKTIKDARAALE